jgi:UDP-2-acetamido-3-amino-2,3-dideoxy-glucuronate N-acetyltransferase
MSDSLTYFAHPTAVIDEGCSIGDGSKIWHFSHLMELAEIGKNCNIGQNVFIANNVVLGKNVKVQNNVSLYSGVICEDDVFLGPSVVFTNVKNPRSAISRKDNFSQTVIKKGASIGANATIVCGVTIGSFAFVGAGAVITKDVLPFALMIGVPAKQTGWMSEHGKILKFTDGIALCRESGEKYKLENGNCERI